MAAIVFETLNYVKKLKTAGMPEAQAEVQQKVLRTMGVADEHP
jgi:hypothetical protein